MSDGVELTNKKGILLKYNFINKVIFRIDFATINELAGKDSNAPQEFIKKISDKFTYDKAVPNNKDLNINIDINSGQVDLQEDGNFIWIFNSKDTKKELTLTANNLVLDYKKNAYYNFHDFLEEILLIIGALNESFNVSLNFLGLRYINNINDPKITENIGEYINPDLSNMNLINNLEKNDEELVQIFTKLNFRKENYLLTLQYGLFNPNFPEVLSDKSFILDYDCVCNDISSIEEIKPNLKAMNKFIFNKFDYSITQKLLDLMKYGRRDSNVSD